MKILRANHPHLDEEDAGLAEIQEYVDRLYDFSSSNGYQSPSLRVFVLERPDPGDYDIYKDVCGRDSRLKYFAVAPVAASGGDGDRGYSAAVTDVTFESASRICRSAGCSHYLLSKGRPSLEEFWI